MPELAIMIEGQNGLNWPRWKRIAHAVEDLGFTGLYRSDHYTNAGPPDLDSLELWISLAWLADHTARIEFGPLVSPLSFRHPTMLARYARDVDDLSGGRLHFGLGAGWQEREHTNFGLDLLDVEGRFRRFEEGLTVITRLLQGDGPVDFAGEFYTLRGAVLLPRPARPGGPPILIGGNGERRTLPLVARFASMWNAVYIPPARLRELNARLDELLEAAGRHPADVHRSIMTGLIFGRDDAEVGRKLAARPTPTTREDLRARGVVVGTPAEVVDHLGQLGEAGAARVMLQWLDLDDLDGLEALASTVLPQLR